VKLSEKARYLSEDAPEHGGNAVNELRGCHFEQLV